MNKEQVIIAESIKGTPQKDIADKVGLTPGRISQIASKAELRAIIEECRSKVFKQAGLQSADNMIDVITCNPEYEEEDKEGNVKRKIDYQLRGLKYKYSAKLLETMGVFPSHGESIVINQVFNQQNTVVINEASRDALKYLGIDLIEAESCESDNNECSDCNVVPSQPLTNNDITDCCTDITECNSITGCNEDITDCNNVRCDHTIDLSALNLLD